MANETGAGALGGPLPEHWVALLEAMRREVEQWVRPGRPAPDSPPGSRIDCGDTADEARPASGTWRDRPPLL